MIKSLKLFGILLALGASFTLANASDGKCGASMKDAKKVIAEDANATKESAKETAKKAVKAMKCGAKCGTK